VAPAHLPPGRGRPVLSRRRFSLLLAALGATAAVFLGARWLYPLPYSESVFAAAARHGLDPLLVAAVIRVESRFHPGAVSAAGARGLMQVLPGTGEWVAGRIGLRGFRAEMLYDPAVNVAIGTWYLAYLRDEFGGSVPASLAAYNAGRQVVAEWLAAGLWDGSERSADRIPFPETRRFVRAVLRDYRVYRLLYAPLRKASGRLAGITGGRENPFQALRERGPDA